MLSEAEYLSWQGQVTETHARYTRLMEGLRTGKAIDPGDVAALLRRAYRLGAESRGVTDFDECGDFERKQAQRAFAEAEHRAAIIGQVKTETAAAFLTGSWAVMLQAAQGQMCLGTELVEASYPSRAEYVTALHSAVRGLWSGATGVVTFLEQMEVALTRHLVFAWLTGFAVCGLEEDDMNTDEIDSRSNFIKGQFAYTWNLAEWIEEHNKANEGTLEAAYSRAVVWEARWDEAYTLGKVAGCRDSKAVWTLGAAEHCFIAGTLVSMADGSLKPIEQVAVGEQVLTSVGARAVTKLWARDYQGPMVRVQADGREVLCTPNHPFRLPDGNWRRADQLRDGDMIVNQYGFDKLFREVTLPDADNRMSVGAQVGILSGVASLLGKLPFGQRLKAGMPMPVVAVHLDDKRTDPSVNHEVRFDDGVRLKVGAETFEAGEQGQLKFGGLQLALLLTEAGHKCKLAGAVLWALPKSLRFGFRRLIVHRVVLKHVPLSPAMHALSVQALGKGLASPIAHGGDARVGHPKLSRNLFVGERFTHLENAIQQSGLILQRVGLLAARSFGAFQRTILAADVANVYNGVFEQCAAKGARDKWPRARFVSARGRAEFECSVFGHSRLDDSLECLATELASKRRRLDCSPLAIMLGLRHGSPLLTNSVATVYHIPTMDTRVYNLEVASQPEYFANGFLVHNCSSCLKLSGKVKRMSFWNSHGILPRVAGADYLICRGYKCACSLELTDAPLSKGSLPRLP